MNHLNFFIVLSLLFPTMHGHAQKKRDEMNGIKLEQYKDFQKNWKLITVRFRRDSGEQRFTYANKVAWEAMKKGVKEYPEGSIFAKISLMTQDDPAFASSAEPSGAMRIQFMVKNKAKYADTRGWGYALFNPEGQLFPDAPNTQTRACAACHDIVPNRDYVFSRPMPFEKINSEHFWADEKVKGAGIYFVDLNASKLAEPIRAYVNKFAKIRSVEGELRNSLFQGTLDEIRPALAAEAKKTDLPAALISIDNTKFSIVIPRLPKQACGRDQKGIQVDFVTTTTHTEAVAPPAKGSFCQE